MNALSIATCVSPPVASDSPRNLWYAAWTCANHEKRIAEKLSQHSIEHFLPCYESVRRWKDRRINLRMPLFPGYVFVRIDLSDRLHVLQISGVARLVSFNGIPAVLPEAEITALKAGIEHGVRAAPHPYLNVGRRVRVTTGPLEGLEGLLIRKKGALRFVISLQLIMRSVAVEVDAAELQPVRQ